MDLLHVLEEMAQPYDAMRWLQADGFTRVLHRVLLDAGIEHTVWVGSFVYKDHQCPFHMWITVEVPAGRVVIDYRARNWFKIAGLPLVDEQDIPHGVFSPNEQQLIYSGNPAHIDRLDDRVFAALLEPPLSLELLKIVQ